MASRNSGQYLANNPIWYRKKLNRNYQNNLKSGTIGHIVGDPFLPDNIQQAPFLPNASSYSSTPTNQQLAKLEQLSALLQKYANRQVGRKTLESAKIRLTQGDEGFLDQELHQLHMIDARWRTHLE
jgi:hypothetical protein